MRDSRLLEFLTTTAWAMHEPILEKLTAILYRHAAGVKLDATELEPYQILAAARQASDDKLKREASGGIAVVPIRGVITRHAAAVDDISAPRGTSVDEIRANLERAVGDPKVHTILLHVDSPGGAVDGITEVTSAIDKARQDKRVVALADGSMASLAYWIGSQAEAIYTTPTSAVGSIGVYSVVVDTSGAAEDQGVKVHLVKAGEHKGLGEPGVPVTKPQLAGVQDNVDAFYDLFVDAVAQGRGLKKKSAVELADGRVHIGAGAVEMGLADRVASYDDTIETLTEPPGPTDEVAAATLLRSDAVAGAPGEPYPEHSDNPAAQASPTEEHEVTTPKKLPQTQTPPPPNVVDSVPPVATTAAELRAAYPELVAAIVTETTAQAITAERERIAFIEANAMDFQSKLAAKLVADGIEQDAALRQLHTDLMDNGTARAAALVAADPLGGADSDPDGGGIDTPGPRAFNERTGGWEDQTTDGPDYAACDTEDEVTELAMAEFKGLGREKQKALGGKKAFCALRRGEFQERQAEAG